MEPSFETYWADVALKLCVLRSERTNGDAPLVAYAEVNQHTDRDYEYQSVKAHALE